METEGTIRLETVEKLTRDRDLVQRHIKFLTAQGLPLIFPQMSEMSAAA